MRVLVIGSGGREHALVWKIGRSALTDKVFCAPGNGGIAQHAECLPIAAEDTAGLCEFAVKEKIDLTVVGPEAPLAAGLADEFRSRKLGVFGPGKKASRLEASKVFAKELMAKYGVPTAAFQVFDEPQAARRYIEKTGSSCVVKADGLAAGKGVVVAADVAEAVQAVELMMGQKAFGRAGERIIVEECLRGQEASILVFTDGKTIVPLASSQDHKRVFDADRGPNTGGMGAYSPAPVVTEADFSAIMERIISRTLDGLAREGIEYRGVLYAGVMLTAEGPKALEFNVRFGDPETQAILPRLESDLVSVMLAASAGRLAREKALAWEDRSCVCVVCASGGYPGEYKKGKAISGLDEAGRIEDVVVFHAATQKADGQFLTSGGRVLGVTGRGDSIREAIDRTYRAVEKIHFEGMHYRRDIGHKALEISAPMRGGGG